MNKKDLYAVLKDKTRIAWVEVFTDPEAGDGLRVWFEDWRGLEFYRLEFYRSKATFVKWLEEWDIVSTAAAEKAARALLPGGQLLPMYRGPKCTFVQIKTKSTKAGEKYAYSWVNLDLIN